MRHSIAWPRRYDVVLGDRQRLARGDQDLLAHDVDAGDLLGHAVLDLHARVHLEEEVLAVLQQALDRAGRVVADGLGGVDGDLADLLAQLVVDQRGRRLLDQLLVAALDRAVALAEVDRVALLVGEHLDLDVARVGQVALEVDGVVGEELLALARGALERLLELVGLLGDAEALAAAAARGLDRDRVADVLGDLLGVLERLDRLGGAGHDRHAGALHQLAGAGLRAHRLDRGGGRADEGDALLLERGREGGVLGQEAVAGVHGLGAGLLDHLEQLVDLEVGLGCRPGPEQVGLGGALDVLRVAVGLRVDGDGGDAELVERADHAHGDLPTVGDEDLAEHRRRQDIRRPMLGPVAIRCAGVRDARIRCHAGPHVPRRGRRARAPDRRDAAAAHRDPPQRLLDRRGDHGRDRLARARRHPAGAAPGRLAAALLPAAARLDGGGRHGRGGHARARAGVRARRGAGLVVGGERRCSAAARARWRRSARPAARS